MSGSSVVYDGYEAAAIGLNRIADPGDAGTIRVDRSPCFVPLQSAAAETRTLATPDGPGMLVILSMQVDGGDITLTVTNGFDQAGNTTITFAAVGDHVLLISSSLADGSYEWRKVASDGATGTGVQGSALTAQDTDITHTAPSTPDFAIQDLTSSSPFGFVTKDEGNTVLQVIANLQTRLQEVEDALEATGIVASN